MNTGQLVVVKPAGMLSRMLGSGLADAIVLVVDGFGVPRAMEKVVVTGMSVDVVVDSSSSATSSDSFDSWRFWILRR